MGRKAKRKLTKREHCAIMKRRAEAMRELKKRTKIMKTSQPVHGIMDIQHVTMKNDNLECNTMKKKIDIVEQEEKEDTVESDDTNESNNESGNDAACKTQSIEELWFVRRQLCRGCHSDGAFWSLQTTTEGVSYGDLLQTYYNIQLCPVSKDEPALSAICALCAARVREARAFSAQARAAEERFTRLYKQNRVRVLVHEEDIKIEDPKIFNEVVDSQLTDDDKPDTANSNTVLVNEEDLKTEDPKILNEVDDSQITDDDKPDTANSNTDDLEAWIEESTQARCDKHAPKKFSKAKRNCTPAYRLSPTDYERIGDSFKCTRCEKQYNSVTALRFHVKSLHINIAKYTCTLCAKTFRTLAPFMKHKLDEHSIDDRIKCNACDSIFNTRIQLLKHKNNFHMLGVKRACAHCDYECFSKEAMYKHKFKHKSVKDYQCRFCKKSFVRKATLHLHERIHTGDKRKVCKECGQAFVQKSSLNYHMAKYHPEVKF